MTQLAHAWTISFPSHGAEMVRTPAALGRTMAHLASLLDAPAATLQNVYIFLSDRYRAVRTDIQAQQLSDSHARSWLAQQVAPSSPMEPAAAYVTVAPISNKKRQLLGPTQTCPPD